MKRISESKKLALLKTDGARLLYTWLIPHLDINGCFSGDPEVINGKIFTRLKRTPADILSYLMDLSENKLIVLYQANGDDFLQVPDFVKRQPHLNPEREADPVIPPPTQDELMSISGEDQEISRFKGKSKSNLNSKSKVKKIYVEGETPYDLSLLLLNEIKKNKPDFLEPNLQLWAKDFEKMLRIDKRGHRRIPEVIRWCQQDDFWQSNILSPSKLRKQFDKLEMQMNRPRDGGPGIYENGKRVR